VLQKTIEEVAECLRRAAEAEARAEATNDGESKADYLRLADSWRALAYSYEFQGSLGCFISFNDKREEALPFLPPANRQTISAIGSADAYAAGPVSRTWRNDAETILRNTPILLTRCSSDLRYVFVSEAYARMLGHRPEVLVGKKIAEVIGESAFQTILPYVNAVLAGQCVEYEAEVPYKDVGSRFVHVTYAPDKDQFDSVQGWIASIIDVTAHRQADVALRERDQRLRWLASIVEFNDDAIVSKNLDGIITSWNKGAERIFGYTAEEAIGRPVTIVIPRDRQDEERDILARIRRGEHIDHFETIRQHKQGSLIAVSLTISPVKDAEGKIVGASKIARDITEQKRNQEKIATLAREAEHRSKNLLANVLATVQLSQADTPEGLKQAIEGRIRALANVHSLFVEARWIGAELSSIASQELAPYSEKEKTRVRIDGPQVLLEPNAAQSIAMILHELVTNAVKYGALSVADGRVDLKWSCEPNGGLRLHWAETDGPAVQEPMRRGFGRRIIEILVAEKNGKTRFDWRAEGLVCEITVQL
jgi:PAS domain S-box-containing protein